MKFKDPELQQHYDRVIARMDDPSEELRPVGALLEAYSFFKHIDGEQAPRVHDVVEHLAAPDLRPALRQWFRTKHTAEFYETNPGAKKIRQKISELVGETL